jgi:hypothetical protein
MEELIRLHLQLDASSPSGLAFKDGTPALCLVHGEGYLYGTIKCVDVLAHRAVYLLHYGDLPAQVDHENGNKQDNSPGNLRSTNHAENQHNRVTKGYSLHKASGLYTSDIMAHGKRKRLGYFTTPEAAREAYLSAKRELHPTAPERCYATP